ncbi:MAG: A/G-specific adenine glycosylase [Nitrospiraceae bacterium]|nr:A/G-specific adenine glycosylase [Nitrospiraceae bacterium]
MSPSEKRRADELFLASEARPLLLLWYDKNRRDLPWRRSRDPYRVWVSEIMLQQTTVKTVLGYYDRFLGRFPTVIDLARADLSLVLKLWEGLGYYQRARNLHRAAGIVAGNPGPLRWPQSVEEWQSLPGIGRSTAGAIFSLSTDRWAPILDANVRRVTGRLFGLPDVLPGREARLWAASNSWGPGNPRPGDTNQALMELGAILCKPSAPSCDQCPLASLCRTRSAESKAPEALPGSLPKPRAGKNSVPLRKRVALVPASGLLHFEPRGEGRLLEGLLEVAGFPSPGLSPGERVGEGAYRGWQVVEELFAVRHVYSHFREEVRVFLVSPPPGAPGAPGAKDLERVCDGDGAGVRASLSEADRLALTGVSRKIVERLKKEFSGKGTILSGGSHPMS